MVEIVLTENQKDALREIGSICAGNAATALSQLTQTKIDITIPQILFLPLERVPEAVGGADRLVTGLLLQVLGDLRSRILFIFFPRDALILTTFMTNKPLSEASIMTDIERSALREIGVVLASAYLGVLSNFVGMSLIPTVPELITDMAGAIVDYILIELSSKSQFALLVKSEFTELRRSVTGHFFLVPDPTALEIIIKAIDEVF